MFTMLSLNTLPFLDYNSFNNFLLSLNRISFYSWNLVNYLLIIIYVFVLVSLRLRALLIQYSSINNVCKVTHSEQ